jgi:hypothetical protein
MYSGKITNSSVYYYGNSNIGGGGGVYNNGTFSMYGGEISSNSVSAYMGGNGGGVYNNGIFTMSGGTISNNTAGSGGGIYNYGIFEMLDGMIDNNTVKGKPPGNNSGSSGISPGLGGGVCNSGTFTMSGGTIFNNRATSKSSVYGGYGGGVFTYTYVMLAGGKISGNTATNGGGGIGVYNEEEIDNLFVGDGVVFENNRASKAYNRASTHDSVYNSHIGNKVTWSTPFTQGYNNYDISYTNGTKILIVIDTYTLILAIVLGAIISGIVTAYVYISKKDKKK